MPTVSVILPTYNRAETLARAVRSVLAQSLTDLELIVVDDGSTDDTAQVLNSFSDSRLRVLKTSGRLGAARARNMGAQEAQSDFLAFQDSDDEWLLDKLEQQLKLFSGNDVAMVCCGYLCETRCGGALRQGAADWMQEGVWDDSQLFEFRFITPTWVVRRSMFMALSGFDEEMRNLEDWELAWRFFAAGRIVVTDQPLVVKYGMDDSLNGVLDNRIDSLHRMLTKHALRLEKAPAVVAGLYGWLGSAYCHNADMVAGRRFFKRALWLEPLVLRRWIQFLATLFGQRLFLALSRVG